MKEVSPMEDKKIYLLAELTILPGFLEEVKAIFKEAVSIVGRQGVRSANTDQIERTLTMGTPQQTGRGTSTQEL